MTMKMGSCLVDNEIDERTKDEIYTLWIWKDEDVTESEITDLMKRIAAICQMKGFNIFKLFQYAIDHAEKCKVRFGSKGELFDMDFSGYAFEYMDECVPQADQPEGRGTQTEICFP